MYDKYAVVDTNVFVSSFFGGNPRKVIDLWKTGELTLCLSTPIVDEYVAVLRRLGLEGEPRNRGHNTLSPIWFDQLSLDPVLSSWIPPLFHGRVRSKKCRPSAILRVIAAAG